MPDTATWTADELIGRLEQEAERRRLPSPGGRAAERPSVRTLRYYTTLGLVDRPLGYAGGSARYGPRHLWQYLAIKTLQGQFLPLPEIQKRLYGRSDEELLQIVEAAPAREERRQTPATWLALRPAPGLLLLVEDREALHDWLRRSPPEEVRHTLEEALQALSPPPHETKEESR